MSKNFYVISIIAALFVFGFLFAACGDPSGDNNNGIVGNNPGQVKGLGFSHKSGHYAGAFSLSFTAAEGAAVYYSIDGSIPDALNVDDVRVFKYTAPIQIKDRNNPVQPNFLATKENSAKFYGNVNDPRGDMPVPFLPNDIDARTPKASVIRAIAVNANGNKSDVATLTFFLGNNLANYGNNRIISLVTDPSNLLDENLGIYVQGIESNRWEEKDSPTSTMYNFRQRGTEWERRTAFTLFDSNRTPVLIDEVAIRVRGGYSRALGQKSMNIYFRGEYGGRNVLENFVLIPGALKADGAQLTTTKSFMIRNGGNDAEQIKLRDPYIQSLVSDRNFSTQSSVPCIVYLNGEYWGLYNLQERYSDNHTEYVYGVNRNNVVSVEAFYVDDGTPQDQYDWDSMMSELTGADMSIPANYDKFLKFFDLQSFLDYWAAEIYIYNWDWPQNNFRMWKTRNVVQNNKDSDGKWRYQMLDTEFSMGIYEDGSILYEGMENLYRIIHDNGDVHSKLFASLIKNDGFKRDFVNTMMDLYNVNFNPDTAFPKLDEIAGRYKPLLDDFYNRWVGTPWKTPDEWISNMKTYMTNIRPAMVYNYLPKYFNAGTASNVTLTSGLPNVPVKINTVTPALTSGNWTGKYFTNCPVSISAGKAPAGYEFTGWTISGGSAADLSAASTTVTISGDAVITANYKLTAPAQIPVTNVTLNKSSITLTTGGGETLTANVIPGNATVNLVSWTSSNYNVASVSSGGRVTATGSGSATITASTLDGNKKATCSVTVNSAINSISLDVSSFAFGINDTRKLIPVFNPSNAPNKNVTWSSSNPSVASVSLDGTVTAAALGTAIITVRTADGNKTAACTVNVREPAVLFDLAEILGGKSTGVLDSDSKFNNIFGSSSYIRAGGDFTGNKWHSDVGQYQELRYEIINENGVNKFKITGLQLEHWESKKIVPNDAHFNLVMNFQAGDKIEIKGNFTGAGGLILQTDNSGWNGNWWKPLQGWGVWSAGNFEKNFTLTQSDAKDIANNYQDWMPYSSFIKVTTSDAANHSNNAVIIIDQLKIYRY